jgi:transposase
MPKRAAEHLVSPGVTLCVRKEQALLDEIRGSIEAAQSVALPPAPQQGLPLCARAVQETYTTPGIPGTGVEHKVAENLMRSVALGRKNWIHTGGSQAGPKIAVILLNSGKLP